MFKNMQKFGLSGDNIPEFLLTHPITTRRITESEKHEYPNPGIIDSFNFKLIKKEVEFLMTDNLSIRSIEKELVKMMKIFILERLLKRKNLTLQIN